MDILDNIIHTLKIKKYFIIFVIGAIGIGFLYAFFFGMVGVPFINIRLQQMIFPDIWDYIYLGIFAIFVGLFSAVYLHYVDANKAKKSKEMILGTGGLFAGFITAMCPFCPLVILSVFGITGTLMFLEPFYPVLKIASLLAMFGAIILLNKNLKCVSCNIHFEEQIK